VTEHTVINCNTVETEINQGHSILRQTSYDLSDNIHTLFIYTSVKLFAATAMTDSHIRHEHC